MNRSLFAFCLASPLLAFAGCALDEQKASDDVPATGGAAGSGTPTGGSSGSAGSGVGGTPATGGVGNPTGGAAGSSVGGSGGSVTTGGTGGMGTGGDLGGAPPGGSGGAPPGGSGGAPPGGSGGAPPGGSGGAPPGGSGGAAPGGSGGGGALTPASVVPGLDGYTQTYPCGGGDVTNYDCVNSGCQNGQDKEVTRDFMVMGPTTTTYELTFRVRGVVEAKNYTGGTRRAGNGAMDASEMGGDFLYTGGSAPDTTYNEYSLRVTSGAVSGQPSFYGMNARNGTSEVHESWALNFTFTLRVNGGGVIRYRMFDSNCRQITNCGTGTGSTTCGNDQRILTFAGADPMPTMLNQPYLGAATAAGPGQWIFFDVTSVTVVP